MTLCKITNENNEKGLCLCMNTYHMYTYTPPTHHHHTHTHLSGAGLTLSFPNRRTQAEGISWCRAVPVWGKVSDEGKVKHFFLLLLICFVLFFAPPEAYNLPSKFWNSYSITVCWAGVSVRQEYKDLLFSHLPIPVADSCWYMAKPIQYCQVKK